MKIPNSILGTGLAVLLSVGSTLGASFVRNPSFENNVNTNTAPLSPGAPQGWPYYSSVDEWSLSGGGVNDLVYDAGGPFHNAGTPVPDGRRIGFKQGGGAVSQDISGLTPGKRYWIQFRYDARSGSDLDLAVRFSTVNQGGSLDEQLDLITKPKPATTTKGPYYSRTVPFTPDLDSGTLSFEVTSRGDATALLDAVSIIQRDEGNFVVINPSFEASGVVFDGVSSAGTDWPAISGWAKIGAAGVDDGTGGEADNGAVPDQDLVAFIRDEGSLTQTLEPLVKDDNYQVEFAYNAKSGTTPHLQVKIGDTVVWEKDVTAVGGAQSYAKQTFTFKAASDVSSLTFANTVAGSTLLLDDVKVLGKTGTRLPPLEMTPARALLRIGDEAVVTVTIPQERLVQGPAVIKVRSANASIFVLPEADATGTLSLQFQGTTTQTFRIMGRSVGSAAVEITDSAGLLLPTDITTVFVVGSTFVLNPSFELDKDSGVGTAPVSGWTTGGGNIGMAENGNPFLSADDLTIPDRRKVLRIQGGGTVSQMIRGLRPGKQYGLQFFYNGRTAGYPYELALQVSFDGKQLANLTSIAPASQGGLVDYYFQELRFTPTDSRGLLEFKAVVTGGDATLFLDAVSIVPRLADEIAIMNSSFEGTASGANWPGYLQPDRVAGWQSGGGGYGLNAYSPTTFFVEPFFDNGINSDQDNVFFGQGGVFLSQTVTGLTPGQAYTLIFDYNCRDGRGQNSNLDPNPGQVEVSVDGAVVLTTDEFSPADTISPWPGFLHTRPMYQAFVPLTASAETAEIRIAHVGVVGDETMLVDNVRLLPGTRTPPTITRDLVDQEVPVGGQVIFTVGASGTGLAYRWFRDGVPLEDGALISGATTATLSIATVLPSAAGTYSALVSDGLGVVGSLAQLTVTAVPNVPTLRVRLVAAGAELRWPTSAVGFWLQRMATLNGQWADDHTPVVVDGEDNVATIPVDGTSGFFRLTDTGVFPPTD